MVQTHPKSRPGKPDFMRALSAAEIEAPSTAQMALFTFAGGWTLEIHIPWATGIGGGHSRATTPGFVLRREREIVNVGVLADIFEG